MLDRLLQASLWGGVVLVFAVMFINAAYMLLSPMRWFELPTWLRLKDTPTLEQYRSQSGMFQLRIFGGIIILSIGWVVGELILRCLVTW